MSQYELILRSMIIYYLHTKRSNPPIVASDCSFTKMLHWINRIVLLSLEPLAGELKYASVEWSAAGAWAGRYIYKKTRQPCPPLAQLYVSLFDESTQ
jgi:hypothetical protein